MKDIFFKLVSTLWPEQTRPQSLPKIFGDLKLTKALSKRYSRFGVGIYTDHEGQKFIVKFWSGYRQDTRYYLLEREINFLRFVKINLRQTGRFFFPIFVNSFTTPSELVLVTRYFPGTQGGDYDAAVDFLHHLPLGLPIPTRSRFYFITLYPLIFVIAILRHRRQSFVLLKSFFTFFSRSWSLFGDYKITFVHGDLHPKNLLTKGTRSLILDTEQAMYTYPEFEVVTTLASTNLTRAKKRRLLGTINPSKWYLFSVLGIFCATYNLGGNSSLVQEKSFCDLLKTCLK